MSFGTTPLSTTTLLNNQFPVSAVYVPGTSGGNLTTLAGGPALSADVNGNVSAPALMYLNDGFDVTSGSTTDVAVTGDVSGTISAKLRGLSKIFAQLQFDGSNFLKVNISAGTVAATQSGTWNINNISGTISLPTGAVLDATVAKLNIAQAAALGTNSGPMVQGSVTTSAPTYTTGNINPLSLTTAGALRVDASATTQPISAASLPLPTGAATSAKQPALGTAGSASTDVLTVQGITSMTPLKVDGSGVTQPISGTVTANAGTGNFTVVQATGSNLHVVLDSGSTTAVTQATASNLNAQVVGSVASGGSNAGNPLKVGGAYNTTQPTVTTGQIVDAQMTARGAQIVATGVDAFAVNASQSGTWNITNISGTVSLPTGAATSAKQPALGTAGSASTDVLTVQGIASMTALKVDGSAVTQPVSGTVTANAGTGTFNIQQSNVTTDYDTGAGTQTMTMFGMALPASGGAVAGGTSSNPLRIDPTGTTTQPVSGTVTANAGTGNFNNASIGSTGSAVPASASYLGANKSGNLTGLSLDGSGNLNVNVAAGSSGNAAASATGSAVPANADYAGINVAGTLRGHTGVNPSGSVYAAQMDVTSVAGSTIATAATGIMKVGLTDGTGTAITSTSNAIDVNIKSGGGSGFSVVDETAWTAGTSAFVPAGGVFNDTATALTSGQEGTIRLTNNRAIHVNLRDASANQLLGSKTSANSIPVVIASDQGAVAVSGTVTANIGTTNGLALDTSVNGILLSQGSTTSGQKGSLIQGAVTTSAPSYTTAQTSPLSLTTAGALRVDGSATTQPVSGTVTANAGTGTFNIQSNASVNVNQIAGSSVSTAATGVQKVGIVGNSGATVDSTIGAGTAPTNAIVTGSVYNSSAPAPTNGQAMALQADQAGNMRTFPGIALATLSAWNSSTGLNATQNIFTNSGAEAVLVQLTQTTTLTAGAVTFEVSYDGSTWGTIPASAVLDPTSSAFAQISLPYTVQASTNKQFLLNMNGAQGLRIKLSTQITGTGTVTPNYALLPASPADTVIALSPTAANFNVSAVQSGTWNINNVSGTVSLPTGAATAAKQPALGTAGSASSDVITVQGIASMTALKVDGSAVTQPVSGTVTANQGGSNWSTNVAQINGVAPTMGNGVSGTGVQRVTIASDSTGQVTLASGANTIGAVTQASGPWTSNITQVGGSAISLGSKTSANSFPVVIASDQGAVSVQHGNVIDSNNSSTATLTANSVFTGTSTSSLNYSTLSIEVFADQASAANGLSIQQSQNGTNWDTTDTFSVSASTAFNTVVNLIGQFYRVVYTNGGTGQGAFRLQTVKMVADAVLPRTLTSLGNLKAAIQEALPTGTNQIGSMTIAGAAATDPYSATVFVGGELRVQEEPSLLFLDDFSTGTIDTTNRWKSPVSGGGGVAATNSVGSTAIGTGTTANGYSYLESQPTFPPANPGWLMIQSSINMTFPYVANTYHFWGIGTSPATPTAAAPLTEAVGFEIAVGGKMYAVCYATGTRNQIQDLSSATGNSKQPTDNAVHIYTIYFRGDRVYWCIDGLDNVVASMLTGANGPNVNTLPIKFASIAGTSAPASSSTITINQTFMADTTHKNFQLSDGLYPWRKATVKAVNTAPTLADYPTVMTLSPASTGLPVNTPAIVQKVANKSSGSVASLAQAFSSNNVAGNSIIVVCAVGNGTAPTISDTNSNTYTQAVQVANGTAFNTAIFYAVNVASGANTVTVNNGGTTASIAMEIYEVSGLIAQVQAQPDITASATGSSGTAATSVISALTPNEYAFAGIGVGTAAQTITTGSGWTNDSGQQNPTTPAGLFSFISMSQYLASLKSVTPQATFTSEPWAIAVATFRPVLLGVEATIRQVSVSNSVLTSVAGSASSVTLFSSNPAAQMRIVTNDSTSSLYLAYAATATTSAYTVLIPSNGYWEAPQPIYTGAISGIWSSAAGNARLTEIS